MKKEEEIIFFLIDLQFALHVVSFLGLFIARHSQYSRWKPISSNLHWQCLAELWCG